MKAIAAVFISTFVFCAAVAGTPDPSASPSASTSSSGSATVNSDAKRDAAVEKHITELHDTLKITPIEEARWEAVAETMRANAKDMDSAIDKRAAKSTSATAIDDLNAYADIAQAHANGVKKLASAFTGLYSAMSDDQKKQADEVFSHRGHQAAKIAKQ